MINLDKKIMANTYTQLYFHIVFAVDGRLSNKPSYIEKNWKDELYKYITGIVTKKDQKLMQINGMSDHVHLLIGTKPNCNLSDLIRDIKSSSSKWVNQNKFNPSKFGWQVGFGAFTVSHSFVSKTATYIENQETHHARKSFSEEYIDFLEAHNIDYSTDYTFESE